MRELRINSRARWEPRISSCPTDSFSGHRKEIRIQTNGNYVTVGIGEKGGSGEEKMSIDLDTSVNYSGDVSSKLAKGRPSRKIVTYADAVRTP